MCFANFTFKIHLLIFGSYRINERKESSPRLSLAFENGELNLYTCSVNFLEGDSNQHYDYTEDVMNENWNPKTAKKSLKIIPKE